MPSASRARSSSPAGACGAVLLHSSSVRTPWRPERHTAALEASQSCITRSHGAITAFATVTHVAPRLLQDDPLAGGGGGAWGAGAGQGAGGFGADAGRGAAYAEDGEQYDVVDIAAPGVAAPAAGSAATPAAPAKGGKTGNGLAASFGFGGKVRGAGVVCVAAPSHR